MSKRRLGHIFAIVGALLAMESFFVAAKAGPVGDALCDLGSSTCTVYTVVNKSILCPFSSLTCHL